MGKRVVLTGLASMIGTMLLIAASALFVARWWDDDEVFSDAHEDIEA